MLTATTKDPQVKELLPRAAFAERHYTLGELAAHWRISVRTLRDWFIEEEGVVKFGTPKLVKGRKRSHVSLRIPQSVAERVYHRMSGREIHRGAAPAIGR